MYDVGVVELKVVLFKVNYKILNSNSIKLKL